MYKTSFRGRRVKDPELTIGETLPGYKSSLTALSDAWSAVAATKEELSDVDRKIKQAKAYISEKYEDVPYSKYDNQAVHRKYRKVKARALPESLTDTRSESWKNMLLDANQKKSEKENIMDVLDEERNKTLLERLNYPDPRKVDDVVFVPTRKLASLENDAVFNDSIENGHTNQFRSSLSFEENGSFNGRSTRRPFLSRLKYSDGLLKLKQKIKNQKDESLNSSPERESTRMFSGYFGRNIHVEDDPVLVSEHAVDADSLGPHKKGPLKRKVVAVLDVPQYKGFTAADATFDVNAEKEARHMDRKERAGARHNANVIGKKPANLKKGTVAKSPKKGKFQRILAPQKPTAVITTASWRIGQELARQAIQQRKKAKEVSQDDSERQTAVPSKDTEDLNSYCETGSKLDGGVEAKPVGKSSSSSSGSSSSSFRTPGGQDGGKTRKDESEKGESTQDQRELPASNIEDDVNALKDNDIDVETGDLVSLSESKALPEEAKQVLAEMELASSDESDGGEEIPQEGVDAKTEGIKKSVKRKAPVSKPCPKEERYPKQKTRHYDGEEVKKYMQKKIAERKKKRMEEKKRQQKMKEEQQRKLEELYERQKKSLRSSLFGKQKKQLLDTFTYDLNKEFEPDSEVDTRATKSQTSTADSGGARGKGKSGIAADDEEDTSLAPTTSQSTHYSSSSLDAGSIVGTGSGRPMSSGKTEGKTNLCHNKGHSSITGGYRRSAAYEDSQNQADDAYDSAAQRKAERIAAIQATANALRERLDSEAKRLADRQRMLRPSVSSFNTNDQWDYPPAAVPKPLRSSISAEVFTGSLPGVGNLDAQVEIQRRTSEIDEAATKIQAMYRGYSVRQGLTWKLPSGDTLGSRILDAGRGRSSPEDLNPLSYQSDFVGSTDSLISDALAMERKGRQSSDTSLTSDQSSLSSRSENAKDQSLIGGGTKGDSNIAAAFSTKDFGGQSWLEKAKARPKGDRYSVINIFTRRYEGASFSSDDVDLSRAPSATDISKPPLQGKSDDAPCPAATIDGLYEQDFEEAVHSYESTLRSARSSLASLSESISQLKGKDKEESSKALFDSPKAPKEEMGVDSLDKTLTAGDLGRQTEGSLLGKESKSPTVDVAHSDDGEKSLCDSTMVYTPPRSPASLTEGSPDTEKGPVMSSTMRDPSSKVTLRSLKKEEDESVSGMQDSFATLTKKTSMYQSDFESHASQGSSQTSEQQTPSGALKYSPGGLANKLQVELNYLESMDTSLLRINEMERLRAVALAQQETVSLAQVLKNRQQLHELDIGRMSVEAKEQARKAGAELERARKAAADATTEAAKTLSEVRTEAANTVKDAAQKLVESQNRAADAAAEAAHQVESARRFAAEALQQASTRQMTDVEALTKSAASAAATSAVQAALQYHKEQLEQLRREALQRASRRSPSSASTSSRSSAPKTKTALSPTDTSRSRVTRTDAMHTTEDRYKDDDFDDPSTANSLSSRTMSELKVVMSSSTRNSSGGDSPQNKSSSTRDSMTRSEIKGSPFQDPTRTKASDDAGSVPEELSPLEKSETRSVNQGKNDITSTTRIVKVLKRKARDSPNNSDLEDNSMKVDELVSSLTEDDLDREFKMVLPSESHLRKSMKLDTKVKRELFTSDNGTSSEDNSNTPHSIVNKHGGTSPFAGEDIFSQFTAEMVRQYVQEEEVRARHQAALLRLREKAIIDKTKAEMAWLELQKKSLRDKGADDLMPPLKKRQRGLWMKLQAEQSEIRKLREAYKAASQERKLMLYQQREIQKMQRTTQKIWSRVRNVGEDGQIGNTHSPALDVTSGSPSETEVTHKAKTRSLTHSSASIKESVKEAVSDEASKSASPSHASLGTQATSTSRRGKSSKTTSSASEVKEDLAVSDGTVESDSESMSQTEQHQSDKDGKSCAEVTEAPNDSPARSFSDGISGGEVTEATESSLLVELRKLKYKTSDQYLSQREAKLKHRRKQFESLLQQKDAYLDRKKKIDEEEKRLKSEIRDAIFKAKTKPANSFSEEKDSSGDSSSREHSTSTKSNNKHLPISRHDTISKQSESDSPISEDLRLYTQDSGGSDIPEEDIVTEHSHRSASGTKSVRDDYSDDTFEETQKVQSQTPVEMSRSNFKVSPVLSFSNREPAEETKSEDESSIAEPVSDVSEIEKRVRTLEEQLRRRKKELDRLRRRRDRENLRKKEQKLKQELQAVENLIHQENKENIPQDITSLDRSVRLALQSPRVLSPRGSLTPTQSPDSPKSASNDQVARDNGASVVSPCAVKEPEKESGTHASKRSGLVTSPVRSKSGEGSDLSTASKSSSRRSNHVEKSVPKSAKHTEGSRVKDYIKDLHVDEPSGLSVISSNLLAKQDSQKSSSYSEDFHSGHSKVNNNTVNSEGKSGSIEEDLQDTEKSAASSLLSENRQTPIQEVVLQEDVDKSSSVKTEIDDQDIYEDDFFESGSESLPSIQADFPSQTTDKSQANKFQANSCTEQSVIEGTTNRSTAKASEAANQTPSDLNGSESPASERSHSASSETLNRLEISLSRSQVSSLVGYHIGDRILVEESMPGTIRYLGKVPFSPVPVAGIELDKPYGTNDGSFHEKRYFECHPDHGLFIPVSKISRKPEQGELREDKESYNGASVAKDRSEKGQVEDERSRISSADEVDEDLEIDGDSVRTASDSWLGEHEKAPSLSEPSSPIVSSKHQIASFGYSEDFEEASVKSQRSEKEVERKSESFPAERRSQTLSQKSSSKSERPSPRQVSHFSDELQDIIKSAASSVEAFLRDAEDGVGKEALMKEDDSIIGVDLDSSGSEGIPEPKRLDVSFIAEEISGTLLKDLLNESFKDLHGLLNSKLSSGGDGTMQDAQDQPEDRPTLGTAEKLPGSVIQDELPTSTVPEEKLSRTLVTEEDSISEELSEAYITPARPEVGTPEIKTGIPSHAAIETATTKLLKDAVDDMLTIARTKAVKLSLDGVVVDGKTESLPKEDEQPADSHLVDDNKMNGGSHSQDLGDALRAPLEKSSLDSALLTEKLNELKTMHRELDDLLGADSDDEDDFMINQNNEILSLPDPDDFASTIPDLFVGEPVLFVPHTIEETNDLVEQSLDIVFNALAENGSADDAVPDEEYLEDKDDEDEFQTKSKRLFKQLIFELSRDMVREIEEFRRIQARARPPWMKPERRPFSKFIHQSHPLEKDELVEFIQNHISVCLGFKMGRPSLDVLKRRLPLNVTKKDYVDAILVEELREDEPQWVNYDEDELRVKFQVTDAILDSLIDETASTFQEIFATVANR